MLPEFIIVELDLDQWIVAQFMSDAPPTYRKLLVAVGQPAAEKAQAALMQGVAPHDVFDQAPRKARNSLDDPARIRIEQNDEGIIQGARGADPDETKG